jgi:hypothetical protein
MRLLQRAFRITVKSDHFLLECFSRWREDHPWRTAAAWRMTREDLTELQTVISNTIGKP